MLTKTSIIHRQVSSSSLKMWLNLNYLCNRKWKAGIFRGYLRLYKRLMTMGRWEGYRFPATCYSRGALVRRGGCSSSCRGGLAVSAASLYVRQVAPQSEGKRPIAVPPPRPATLPSAHTSISVRFERTPPMNTFMATFVDVVHLQGIHLSIKAYKWLIISECFLKAKLWPIVGPLLILLVATQKASCCRFVKPVKPYLTTATVCLFTSGD